jgi:hypothetical protein
MPARAGVEPDIENVRLLAELAAAALLALCVPQAAGRQQKSYARPRRPALEELDDARIQRRVFTGALQPSQRKTAMGTPQMRWRLMHQSGRVAIMLVMRSWPHAGVPASPCRSLRSRSWRKVVSEPSARSPAFPADEPLLGGAEDDRLVAAPAVRVGVLNFVPAQQRAALFEQLDDERVGGEDFLAVEGWRLLFDATQRYPDG